MLAAHPNFWAKSELPFLSGHSRKHRRSSSQAVRDDSFGIVAHLMMGNKPTGLRRQEPETDRRKSIRLPLPGGDHVTLFSAKSMA